jgi:hypothetical protein
MSFYSGLPVIQINEEQRWPMSRPADGRILAGPLLYVAPRNKDKSDLLVAHFLNIWALPSAARTRHHRVVEEYTLYEIKGLKGAPLGRMP